MDVKDVLIINRETFLKLGIHPIEVVKYIENKKAIDITPAHVKALEILKLLAQYS